MTAPKIDWPDLSSPLIYYPNYVQAIGMMVVEMTSMEVMLGDVLGALLNLGAEESNQIYFTPKAAIARIDVIANLATCPLFNAFPALRTKTVALAKRAKALMGKRHDTIHAHWAVSLDGNAVGRVRPPFDTKPAYEVVKLSDLNTLIHDIRQLTKEARHFCDEVAEVMRPETWPQTRAHTVKSAEQLRQDNLRLQALHQARKDPPEPSRA
jgi:hypothetical protein